ncbi:hypothetical protein PVK06_046301 [Gossypium arboreum]|uniref:Uncharacterized protein n=1 Tax=Gossypium arboreum TaxID=29729 RepID=A0ABR0MA86_GOSAR|nr:hypothetical protein PVK06_046301 [Gossypium arboreum]
MSYSRSAVDYAVEKFGTPEIMVNNAGLLSPPSSIWSTVINVNVKSVLLGIKHASAKAHGYRWPSTSCIYTGSTHVVLGLTSNVVAELGKYGIRVNCVSPFAVAMELAFAHLDEDERTDDSCFLL